MVVLARKFRPRVSLQFFFEIIYQLLRIVEEENSIGLFDTGFSFKSIYDSEQGKGDTISLNPLYHFHPSHRHLDINRVITVDS